MQYVMYFQVASPEAKSAVSDSILLPHDSHVYVQCDAESQVLIFITATLLDDWGQIYKKTYDNLGKT